MKIQDKHVKLIVDEWANIINSIEIDGTSKKIESINYFRMGKYYKGYPEIEYCYKVNFDFGLIGDLDVVFGNDDWSDKWKEAINKKLISELEFDHDLIDYVTNQNHRIIIQFYPLEGLRRLRESKIKNLIK